MYTEEYHARSVPVVPNAVATSTAGSSLMASTANASFLSLLILSIVSSEQLVIKKANRAIKTYIILYLFICFLFKVIKVLN